MVREPGRNVIGRWRSSTAIMKMQALSAHCAYRPFTIISYCLSHDVRYENSKEPREGALGAIRIPGIPTDSQRRPALGRW